jgi:23S rRNA (uracil1939-C5)-methyltransferase
MGRKKELPLLEKVRISEIGAEGNALTRIENMVLFVPMLVPGDVADIQVIRKRKKFMEGRVVRMHEYSSDRIKPRCIHFGVCGGCKWQHLPYELQLKFKQKQVTDNITRIGKVQLQDSDPVIGSPLEYYYRNKLEYTFSDKRWLTEEEIRSEEEISRGNALGFHIPGLFDKVLDITECHLQPEPTNRIRNAVKEYAIKNKLDFFDLREQRGFLRNMVVRNNLAGEFMVIMVFFREEREEREKLLDYISDSFREVASLMYVINSKKNDSLGDQVVHLYKGSDHLVETMGNLKFRIGPKSFYQTNTHQAITLYDTALRFSGLTGKENVYDLYTGTGTIANYVAPYSAKVIGIEYVSEAIADARINSEINGIGNTEFFSGDMKDILTPDFISAHGSPDVIITDPPRAGMHEDVVRMILSASPQKVVYVSCNPATQARDIQLLSEKYALKKMQPVDMFPHTHHIENVVLLEKKQEKDK